MKNYRRILVSVPADGRGDILLRRAAELIKGGRAELMALRVLDARSGVASDGPVGSLPGERETRRVPEAKKRLDLMLARHNLGWAESRILVGEPRPAMITLIRDWQPDLVVTCARRLPEALTDNLLGNVPDVLSVGGHGLVARMATMFGVAFGTPAPSQA